MKRLSSASLLVPIVIIASLWASLAIAQGRPIYRITLDDDIINPVTAEYITTSINKAEKDGATCLVIELDTPGGLLSSTRTIVKRIMNANVPIVIYIAPKGSRAGSAGVFITLAGNVAVMAPSTNIGAAHPVQLEDKRTTQESFEEVFERLLSKEKGKEKEKKIEKTPPMDQKILNDTKAWAAAIAKERDRNAEWAVRAVEESVSVTETQAMKLGIIDFVAKDFTDLLERLDGRIVALPSGKVKIETQGMNVVEIPRNFRLRWLSVLAHPNIAYILLMLGFYGLLFEFTHPGVAFPGIAGAVCLILAFFGLQVLPTDYAGVALIVLAIAMFIAEVKVTSYGLLTIGGVITLFLGSLILFASPYEFMRVSLPLIFSFTGATLAIAIFLVSIVIRSRKRRVVTGAEGLIGAHGEVRSSSDDHHVKVFVHGEYWDAESEDILAEGDCVEVVSVSEMLLVVKKQRSKEAKKQEAKITPLL